LLELRPDRGVAVDGVGKRLERLLHDSGLSVGELRHLPGQPDEIWDEGVEQGDTARELVPLYETPDMGGDEFAAHASSVDVASPRPSDGQGPRECLDERVVIPEKAERIRRGPLIRDGLALVASARR